MEEFKTKFMIQLKTPYTHIERAIPITGTLQIEIVSWITNRGFYCR